MQQEENLPQEELGEVLPVVDSDNFQISLRKKFGLGNMQVEQRLDYAMEWIKSLGKLWGQGIMDENGIMSQGHGFVFAPEHFSEPHRKMFDKHGFQLMICAKKYYADGKFNEKTGKLDKWVDTVDECIIRFARELVAHPKFKIFCLIAGDSDYVPLLKDLKKHGIKVALVAPTADSLGGELLNYVDVNPANRKRMVLYLDEI